MLAQVDSAARESARAVAEVQADARDRQ
eukprot:COSAG01_NODE_66591_length_269_cov_1.458824_2_plen_27_part_01